MNNELPEKDINKSATEEKLISGEKKNTSESSVILDDQDQVVVEHHSDEEDHDDEASETDSIFKQYSEYTPQQLYKEAVSLIKSNHVEAIKQHIEAIKRHLMYHLDEERKEKLQEFIEEGGDEIDFSFVQPLRLQFKELYKEYKEKLNSYYKEKKEQLESNLQQKELILEELKTLAMNPDITEEVFEKVRALQDKWKKIGPIPYNKAEHIYNTYSFYLDIFYDNLKLNKDFRDLHFRKNQEIKEEIIQKARELLEKNFDKIADLNRAVRALEKEWRESGPAPKENRENLIKTFIEVLDRIKNKKSELAEILQKEKEEKINQKKSILEELRSLDLNSYQTHDAWQNLTKQLTEYTERFKKIGRIIHPENDKIWEEFNATIREIIKKKNAFYKEFKQVQNQNYQKKKQLIELAKQNLERTDWDEGVNFFKKIQADWKKIGPVPRKVSESMWNEFKDLCNSFFDRYHAFLKEKDKQLFDNLENKIRFIEQLRQVAPENLTVSFLKEQIEKWKSLGKVPSESREIEKEFHKVIDSLFEKLDMDKENIYLTRFETKMQILWDSDDKNAVYIERRRLQQQYDELKKELLQLENNINLFSDKSSSNPFIKEVEKNINRHKANLEILSKKLNILTQFPIESYKPDYSNRGNKLRDNKFSDSKKSKKFKKSSDRKR